MEIITSVAIFTGPLLRLLGGQAGKRSTSFSESARCSTKRMINLDSTPRAVCSYKVVREPLEIFPNHYKTSNVQRGISLES